MSVEVGGAVAQLEGAATPATQKTGLSQVQYRALVWSLRLAIVAAVLIVWQLVGDSSQYWALVIGAPSKIASVLGSWVPTISFWADLRTTLTEAALGYLLGAALAAVTVAIVASVPPLDRFLRPFLAVLNAIPKVALAPLFLVWFGINTSSKVYFVTSMIYFIVFYGIYSALGSIDKTMIDNTRALGASRLQLVRNVHGPAMLSWIISSLRVGGAFALLAAIFAELLGSTGGIGHRISAAQQLLQNNDVMAGVFVIAVAALLLDRILLLIERRLSQWRAF
jgi:NitT/TauT family transport system permease protein